jgi:hypothetical protein
MKNKINGYNTYIDKCWYEIQEQKEVPVCHNGTVPT